MCLQETRILSDNVHDIRRNDGLVVLATFNFAEAEKILDDRHQETFLRLLIYDGSGITKGITKRVHVLIAPEIDPIAQHKVFKFCHDHSVPSTCFASFSVRIFSVSATSKCVR